MANFGELLSELRKDCGMTQKELGAVVCVSGGTISNYETGTHLPDIETLLRLADFFHVTTDYLLGRTPSHLPIDIFEKELLDGQTTNDVLKRILALSPKQRETLSCILHDMYISAQVSRYGKESV